MDEKLAKKDWFIDWVEEWSQLGSDYNWRTFHLVNLEFEDDRMLGAVEITIILVGLGFRWRWTYMKTEVTESLAKQVDAIKKGLSDD